MDALLEEHRSLNNQLRALEKAWGLNGDVDLSMLMFELRETLARHFEAEEASPLYSTLPETSPVYRDRLHRLRENHPDIHEHATRLAHTTSTIVEEVAALIAAIRRHEAEEAEIIQKAFVRAMD